MKYMNRVLWLVVLLLAFPLALTAQSGTQTVDLGDGYEITVPADWDARQLMHGFYSFTTSSNEIVIWVMMPARFGQLGFRLPEGSDALDALIAFGLQSLSREDLEKTLLGDRLVAEFNDTSNSVNYEIHFAVPLSDGLFGYVEVSGPREEITAIRDQLESIVGSFDVAGAQVAASASAGTSGTCTVRASSADDGQLRVGPGENRSAIAFLPANTSVTVTGRIELDDGSIWYQLDKSEAAPQGTAAAELWVNAENVAASGDCDNVGETNAPPVIPISVAPPAATSAPGEPQQPPAQAGALPAPGVWTLSLAPITNASCLGYENVPFSTSEVYTQPTFNGTIVIVNGGSFTFDGNLFRRNGSSNSFSGAIEIPYEGGGSVTTQFRFDLVSANSMTGQMVANYNADDGTPCSDTVAFTATR